MPKPINTFFEQVGKWVSQPFTAGGFPLAAVALATWLGYGIWVMLFAKLLGGRGTLAGFFGVTALYAVPHLLSFFAFIPILGGILGLIAYFWGLAIYIKGTASSHQMTPGTSVAGSGSAGVARAAARLHRRVWLGGDFGDQHVRRPLNVTSDA